MSLEGDERQFLSDTFPGFKTPEDMKKRKGGKEYHRRISHKVSDYPTTDAIDLLTPSEIQTLVAKHDAYGPHTLQAKTPVEKPQEAANPPTTQKRKRTSSKIR